MVKEQIRVAEAQAKAEQLAAQQSQQQNNPSLEQAISSLPEQVQAIIRRNPNLVNEAQKVSEIRNSGKMQKGESLWKMNKRMR